MSRAHQELLRLARLLARLDGRLLPEDVDNYLVRAAQRVIESIEALVRIHNAQESILRKSKTSTSMQPRNPRAKPCLCDWHLTDID